MGCSAHLESSFRCPTRTPTEHGPDGRSSSCFISSPNLSQGRAIFISTSDSWILGRLLLHSSDTNAVRLLHLSWIRWGDRMYLVLSPCCRNAAPRGNWSCSWSCSPRTPLRDLDHIIESAPPRRCLSGCLVVALPDFSVSQFF